MRFFTMKLYGEMEVKSFLFCFEFQTYFLKIFTDTFFNQDTDLIDITNSMFSRNQNSSGTRRETLDTKMADRQMIAQRGVNPFLQSSYVNDIVTRDMFLKPINTTQGRAKENNNEDNA